MQSARSYCILIRIVICSLLKSWMNMGRGLILTGIAGLVLLIVGAGYLMFAEVPAPVSTIEQPVPNEKFGAQ